MTLRDIRARQSAGALLTVGLALAACTGDASSIPSATEGETTLASTTASTAGDRSTTSAGQESTVTTINTNVLPEREGPRRRTTGTVPHIQLDVELFPDVDADLRRRAFSIPGVEDRPSAVSLPGAIGLWIADDIALTRDDVLPVGREFAHFHPDGSLHIWLPVERAIEVDATKWGEIHPWADRDGFWDGTVMVYVPESSDEAEIALRLIVDAYNFITGESLDPIDVP